MKIVYQIAITDDDIRYDVESIVKENCDNEWIKFPNEEARAEFIDDCVEYFCDQYEDGFYDRVMERDEYEAVIIEFADDYGYRLYDMTIDEGVKP